MKLPRSLYKLMHWETWHYLAKYIPIAPWWLWYCARAGSMWFFTPSNPTIQFGGFEGETKKEMYEQLPPGSFPRTIYIDHNIPFEEADRQIRDAGFNYPFGVKPDEGMMGFMFRKMYNDADIEQYHSIMPCRYVVQELVDYPIEVSVFYYRYPGQASGKITGFIRKEFLQVTGDGTSTLAELIENYPRATFRMDEVRSKHADRLQDIIPQGQPYILSYALNLSRGGKLVSLEHEKDERLLAVFDQISHYTKHFYYGRYDIKCASIESLKQGKDFSILEYNGCGAEPHHIYGNNNTLIQAYRIVLSHWKALYEISMINHRAGIPFWSYKKGKAFLARAKAHFKVLKALDQANQVH